MQIKLKLALSFTRLKHFIGDLVAGLTVGLTVIPQGLAYAVVAELPAQVGRAYRLPVTFV